MKNPQLKMKLKAEKIDLGKCDKCGGTVCRGLFKDGVMQSRCAFCPFDEDGKKE